MVFFAESLKSSVWIATASISGGVCVYGTPIEYRLNCKVTSSSADMMAFGPRYMDYRRAVADNVYLANVDSLDKAWIDATPTDLTDTLADDADYIVIAVQRCPGGTAQILFKKLSVDV